MSFITWFFVQRRCIIMFYILAQVYITSAYSSSSYKHANSFDITERVNPANKSTVIPQRIALTKQNISSIQSSLLDASSLAQEYSPKSIHPPTSTASPSMSWKVIESDILIPSHNNDSKKGDVKYGATPYYVELWKKDPATGNYVIPMLNHLTSPTMRERFEWVRGYLARGANIVFRDKKNTDNQWFYFTENPTRNCQANLGFVPGMGRLVNLHERSCGTSIRPVLHEIMHLLGFIHEFQRHDRPNIFTASSNPTGTGRNTEFDPFSITMYDAQLISANPYDKASEPFLKGRSFLSTCDWNLLLTLYPGPNKPPRCRTNEIANVLSPSPDFMNSGRYKNPAKMCHLYNENLFESGECVLPNNQKYPDLKKEFFSNDAIDLTQVGTKTKLRGKKKVRPATKDESKDENDGSRNTNSDDEDSTDDTDDDTTDDSDDDSINSSDDADTIDTSDNDNSISNSADDDSINNSDDHESIYDSDDEDSIYDSDDDESGNAITKPLNKILEELGVGGRKTVRSKSQFCRQYISRNTSILQHEECVSACLIGCKRYAFGKTLTKCMHEKYSPCMRHTRRSSFFFPLSYTASFVITLVYLSLITRL